MPGNMFKQFREKYYPNKKIAESSIVDAPNIIETGDTMVDATFEDHKVISNVAIRYDMPESEGRELRPGHKLTFVIPEGFKGRIVRDVVLRHRKADKYCKDIGPNRHDPHGAYSLVELYDEEIHDWIGWRDPKGYDPIKFAEPRSSNDPEHEVLHDWIATVGIVRPKFVRITNMGVNPDYSVSQIHGIEVDFFPETGEVKYEERIYCSGTSFIDLEIGKVLPTYGGGSSTEGIYRNAIVLNKFSEPLYETNSNPGNGAEISGSGSLQIDLKNGELAQVEIAVGDTEHLKTISPKTGRKTRLGYAKLWMGIQRANSKNIEWFVRGANVPPQGVIAGSPFLEKSHVEDGDKLIIESRDDTSYLMGWRIAYKQ